MNTDLKKRINKIIKWLKSRHDSVNVIVRPVHVPAGTQIWRRIEADHGFSTPTDLRFGEIVSTKDFTSKLPVVKFTEKTAGPLYFIPVDDPVYCGFLVKAESVRILTKKVAK